MGIQAAQRRSRSSAVLVLLIMASIGAGPAGADEASDLGGGRSVDPALHGEILFGEQVLEEFLGDAFGAPGDAQCLRHVTARQGAGLGGRRGKRGRRRRFAVDPVLEPEELRDQGVELRLLQRLALAAL